MCDMIREQPDGDENDEEDELDPRVEIELENLNKSSNDINILEKELDEARASFRQQLTDAARKLKALANSLGNNIDKARPYFEALSQAKNAQQECINAAMTFERACQLHKGARETIAVAEEKLMLNPGMFDAAWQEMLNNANIKIMEAEREKLVSESMHQDATVVYTELENRASQLEKRLKKTINKARPYFDQKAHYLGHLELQKVRVGDLEKAYAAAKVQYSKSLRNLELISEDIHRKRNKQKETSSNNTPAATRQEGVGAETKRETPSRRRSTQRRLSEDEIKKTLHRHHSEVHYRKTGRYRSSLLMDLDVDFDLDDSFDGDLEFAAQKSPSTKSVDIGCVNMRYYDDYQVLDVTPFLDIERRKSRSSVGETIPEIPVFADSLPTKSPTKDNIFLKVRTVSGISDVSNASSEFSNLETSQKERKISNISTSSLDIVSGNFHGKARSGTTHSEFEVIPATANLDVTNTVILRNKASNSVSPNRFSMIAEMDSDDEELDALDNISDEFEDETSNKVNNKTEPEIPQARDYNKPETKQNEQDDDPNELDSIENEADRYKGEPSQQYTAKEGPIENEADRSVNQKDIDKGAPSQQDIDNEETSENEPVSIDNEPYSTKTELDESEKEEKLTEGVQNNEVSNFEHEEPSPQQRLNSIQNEPVTVESESGTVDKESATVENETVFVEKIPVTVNIEPVTVDQEPITVENTEVTRTNDSSISEKIPDNIECELDTSQINPDTNAIEIDVQRSNDTESETNVVE